MEEITRIVKMTFDPQKVPDFLAFFEEHKALIAGMPGCRSLTLLKAKGQNNIYFTISIWEDESYLEAYRSSPFFSEIWPRVKKWMSDKTEAYTLIK